MAMTEVDSRLCKLSSPGLCNAFFEHHDRTFLRGVGLDNYSLVCFALEILPLQWGAADAEIKVLPGENTELKRSPFKAWSRSVYSHTCFAHCQGFLPCLFLPFRLIQLHFFQNLSRFFLCWLWLTHGSCVGPQDKIGRTAGGRFPF